MYYIGFFIFIFGVIALAVALPFLWIVYAIFFGLLLMNA